MYYHKQLLPIALYIVSCTILLQCSPATCFLANTNIKRGSTNVFSDASLSASSILRSVAQESEKSSTSSSTEKAIAVEPDIKAYASGFSTVHSDITYRSYAPSYGKVPSDFQGTYYRVGPGMFTSGSLNDDDKSVKDKIDNIDRMVTHPFEGDGAVLALTFHNSEDEEDSNNVTMRYRYVRTAGFKNENRKRRKLYSGMEATRALASTNKNKNKNSKVIMNDFPMPFMRYHLQPGVNKLRKNTSNTRVVYWSNKLFTTWEGGLPYKLDNIALGTEGKSQFGGIFKRDTALGNKGCYDPIQQKMVFYSNQNNSPSGSTITLWEFNSNFKLDYTKEIKFSSTGYMMMHDFTLTQKYAIFIQPSVTVNNMQFILSKDPAKTLSFDDENAISYVHLIPRDEASPSITIPLPNDKSISYANIQFCNSYEEQNIITIDFIASDKQQKLSSTEASTAWPWFDTLTSYQQVTTKKSLWRLQLDTTTNSLQSFTCLTNKQVSFPTIKPNDNTLKHTFIYMNVGSLNEDVAPPQGILKFNAITNEIEQQWIPEPYEFCGEPIFCSKMKLSDSKNNDNANDDDGYILTVLYNGKTKLSSILLFSSLSISEGPITIIPLDDDNTVTLPHGHHGCFVNDAIWTSSEIQRRCKLADKMEKRSNMWNEVKSDFSGLGLRLDDDFDLEEFFK